MTGMPQHELADVLKIGQPAVSGYESGADFPHPVIAKRLVLWCRKRKIRMSMDEVYERLEV